MTRRKYDELSGDIDEASSLKSKVNPRLVVTAVLVDRVEDTRPQHRLDQGDRRAAYRIAQRQDPLLDEGGAVECRYS